MNEFDNMRSQSIGTVESVSSNSIKVILDINSPHNTALFDGAPRPFPKINSYVLIPNEAGALVGFIDWMGIEHSKYPTRQGLKDFDLIELPFPLRKVSITPVGTLVTEIENTGFRRIKLDRGVYHFPSLGDSVTIPNSEEEDIILKNADENARVYIGNAIQNSSIKIKVDPDKIFGRHLAVLGNTGSGKSCSVAGLIRWSLECALEENQNHIDPKVNSRFIVLDANGEYKESFKDFGESLNVYQVHLPGNENTGSPLQIPAWTWNSQEWISYTRAAPGVQRPILTDALSAIKSGRSLEEAPILAIGRTLFSFFTALESFKNNIGQFQSFPALTTPHRTITNLIESIDGFISGGSIEQDIVDSLNHLKTTAETVKRENTNNNGYEIAVNQTSIQQLANHIDEFLLAHPSCGNYSVELGADTPVPFKIDNLADFITASASTADRDFRNLTTTLELRIRTLLTDMRLKSLINPEQSLSLLDWIEQYLGESKASMGRISVIDLSVVPSEIVHIVVAVFSRLTFESLQRYRRKNSVELPTTLVLEEAHAFVRHSYTDSENTFARLCLEVFEKISREGRKFGLGLLLSSQRPSEISSTVLSQCNTFLLHRIVNDRDQEFVNRLVPDHVSALLKELPNLPTRKAILMGWATPIPLAVEMRELPKAQRPQSADPSFWNVWTGKDDREFNWDKITEEWQGGNLENKEQKTQSTPVPPPPPSQAGDELPF